MRSTMKSVEDLINAEVKMYVNYCQLAAKHDSQEQWYKTAAHMIFYHIQEMRSTGKPSLLKMLSE